MPTYWITWEIELDADSPRAAAEKAQQYQRAPDSLATVFTVVDMNTDEKTLVDLEVQEP